ncbi:hypothetical protein TSUD_349380 [Trifolium subterraneum]|uniref:Uncharacterized protein n=1 Tax=Trifolium subterraneum TaxID=3900 RepID=A0A2Z6NJT2_TRISU|nr:hypothetical protein TSUD_349380 [Trifolium subterraneum]
MTSSQLRSTTATRVTAGNILAIQVFGDMSLIGWTLLIGIIGHCQYHHDHIVFLSLATCRHLPEIFQRVFLQRIPLCEAPHPGSPAAIVSACGSHFLSTSSLPPCHPCHSLSAA